MLSSFEAVYSFPLQRLLKRMARQGSECSSVDCQPFCREGLLFWSTKVPHNDRLCEKRFTTKPSLTTWFMFVLSLKCIFTKVKKLYFQVRWKQHWQEWVKNIFMVISSNCFCMLRKWVLYYGVVSCMHTTAVWVYDKKIISRGLIMIAWIQVFLVWVVFKWGYLICELLTKDHIYLLFHEPVAHGNSEFLGVQTKSTTGALNHTTV